uniref:DDE Tnp4 domain-containing protein n=1 Tax=Lactuca sativa TaxID=4236 RepID=A0A9R1VRV9_LACSA|nr:hypothetical protein LSAT_V11C400180810 [Lactuca sativa]
MDNDLSSPAHIMKSRQTQVVHLICLLMAILAQSRLTITNQQLLHNLSNGGKCRELIRMSEQAFKKLCTILQSDGGLRPTQCISVEEHVAIFLHIGGNDLRYTFVSWIVFRTIISLESRYIQQPKGDVVPKEIQEKKRFFPYFKNCIGATDGTHVRVKVPNKEALRYRGHKKYPTIKVLAACSFGLKFAYVLIGREDTASDSRILKNALNRDDKLVIPNGRYCLVDVSLPHTSTLTVSYRGVRYHLKGYSLMAPENARELFNLRHSSLRNVIERAFGVLKVGFLSLEVHTNLFILVKHNRTFLLECCILHNFLRVEDRDKDLEDEVLQEVLGTPTESET